MKKIKGIFGLVVLCSFFSFQSASCMLLGALVRGVTENIRREQQEDEYRMEEWKKRREAKEELRTELSQGLSAVTRLETSFSDEALYMSTRIQELINKKLDVGGTEVSLFPTPKAKIFVLQNIEDFLSLPAEDLLYRYVYEECMKQIRIEENELNPERDAEGNVYFVDLNSQNKEIDQAREKYMQDYGVTKEKIKEHRKDRDVSWAEHKQYVVKKGLEDLIGQSVEERKTFSVNDPVYQAHISILAHLIYLAGNKASMMSEDERSTKAMAVEKEQAYKKERLRELRSLTDAQKKNIRLGSSQETEEQFQEKSKGVVADLYSRIANWLTKKQGIEEAQKEHEKKRLSQVLSSKGEPYQVPEFTEEELPQNMTDAQRKEYAQKIEKLYPIKMNPWDRLKAFFGFK